MKIMRYENITHYKYKSHQLIQSLLSPLCGIAQEIGFVSRTQSDNKLLVGSGALTGVHVLFNKMNPGRGAYHIGGSGFLPQEAMIRVLGETVERYAQLISNFSHFPYLKYASYNEIVCEDDHVLPFEHLIFYSAAQLSRMDFPFTQVNKENKISWIKMFSCFDHSHLWIPAQFVLVGYNIKQEEGEPWITTAVTTGTAAHTNKDIATRSALLELIQLDTVMGHWYSACPVYEIEIDKSLSALTHLLKRYSSISSHQYIFYYLPNPDLKGVTVACVYLQEKGMPRVVIGLGADLNLENAMYKAFLEMAASLGLSRMVLLKGKYGIDNHNVPIDPLSLYDLDRNVEYYAAGSNFSRIEERFLNMPKKKASQITQEQITHFGQINAQHSILGSHHPNQIEELVSSFKKSDKQLYYLDLTNIEAESLGFYVVKVWSPQTLGLCLPSAPQVLHPRFKNYGGLNHEDPHPYP